MDTQETVSHKVKQMIKAKIFRGQIEADLISVDLLTDFYEDLTSDQYGLILHLDVPDLIFILDTF